MNRFLLAVALGLVVGGAAQAAVIDLTPSIADEAMQAQPRIVVPAVAPSSDLLTVHMSELPEPEVFAMMLVGLVLLGYRARRDSNEKFK